MNYTTRILRKEEVMTVLDHAAAQGWNPGLHDDLPFFSADPAGFIGCFAGDELAGFISAVAYDDLFGFIGCYIVTEGHRNTSAGVALARAALSYLGPRNIGLDGVFERQDSYARLGFAYAYRNIRYRYQPGEGGSEDTSTCRKLYNPDEELFAYDRQCFPAGRKEFLGQWIAMPGAETYASYGDGIMKGYGTVRECRTGYKIGPLFADDPDTFLDLFTILTASRKGDIFIDIPEPNTAAIGFAEEKGMQRVFGTARMYSQGRPQIALEKIYGVTTFELG